MRPSRQDTASGFSEQKESDSDFMIFVLTDDNYNGKKYYGKQSDFDMRDLHKQCGLYNYYGSISGYYTYIKLSSYTSIPILCQRINNDVNLDNLYTITMDLRPKAWTKWTYTRFQLSDHEIKLLGRLCESSGESVSREELNRLLGADSGNIADVYICRLRRKLESGDGKRVIFTVRSAGYKIITDMEWE